MGEEILKDSRFAHLLNDPRYKYVPKTERKVKIDKRFQSMFKDKKFKVNYSIDKRGRPVSKTSTEDLKKYYDISSSEEESDEQDEDSEGESQEAGSFVKAPKPTSSEEDSGKEDEEGSDKNEKIDDNINDKLERGEIGKEIKNRLKDLNVDYARGEANILSDSSSDEESSSEEEPELELQHCWGELDRDAERTEEATHRLAACNMDWDRIRASDIMVLCNSFLPKDGLIHSVTIYPSEFGLKRMAEEDANGPIELTEAQKKDNKLDSEDENNEEGSTFHMERLRQYQLNRLKYYYAVIVLDSKETAEKLYNECDGLEYESSATKLDLRFIPDDVTFDEKPHEICTELPELTKYQPRQFTTTALQQAKVELTWDETCPARKEIAQKLMSGKIDDVTDADLRDYLASSSGEEDNAENVETNADNSSNDDNSEDETSKLSTLDKYKALLQDIHQEEEAKKNKGIEMEVSWGLGLKDKTQKLVKDKLSKKSDMTPFEEMVEKIKEKKKAKREEKRKKIEEEERDSDSSDEIPDGVDMNDPYFAEEFQNSEFEKPKPKTKKKKVIQDDQTDSNDEKTKKELELLLMDDEEAEEKAHFSLKKIQDAENDTKSKSKRRKKILKRKAEQLENNKGLPDFEVDVDDDRFSALYTSHHFNIDPTDSHYKKTKGMESLIKAKLTKRAMSDNKSENGSLNKKPKKDVALNMMVKNIKRNAVKLKGK